jgi:hypothetical protein
MHPQDPTRRVVTFRIEEIPDPSYPLYLVAARGDVLSAVAKGFEHLMRTVGFFTPKSASLAIMMNFNPTASGNKPQSRLRLYMQSVSTNLETSNILSLALKRGPLSHFYRFCESDNPTIPWSSFTASCHIVRRIDWTTPLQTVEFNALVPPAYTILRQFEACEANDYLNLDRVFGGIDEPVLVSIGVEPVDIEKELAVHTRYLARLKAINRRWDIGQDDFNLQDYIGDDPATRYSAPKSLKPLHEMDPLADDVLDLQRRFHECLHDRHLKFQISVLASSISVAQLIASVVAESSFENGSYHLFPAKWPKLEDNYSAMCSNELLFNELDILQLHEWETAPDYSKGLAPLQSIGTVEELTGVFRLPVASLLSPCCIRKNTDPSEVAPENLIVMGHDHNFISINHHGLVRGIHPLLLCKHGFFSGVSGSGKTTAVMNLLIQLNKLNIPFLIIEPVKTEYRILKTLIHSEDGNARSLGQTLQIYTPGNESISPFRYNPLELLSGISTDEHIDNLANCFFAAMPATWPLPAIIGEGLERVYDEAKDGGSPVMADLVQATRSVLVEKGYSSETNSDIKAALEVRLGVLARRSIGKVFECPKSVPSLEHLMNSKTLLELGSFPPEQASLLTLFLLTGIREYIKTDPWKGKGLRFAIILEEAHNIAGAPNKAAPSPDVADPKANSTEMICRALAELRALNIGIVIIDQLPSAVAPEVIKNTTTKLAFRQVARDDREELGAAMLLGETELEDIARLGVGQAFFMTEGYYKPCRIQTINLYDQFDLKTTVFNTDILPYMSKANWFTNAATTRRIYELRQAKSEIDRFDNERLGIIDQLTVLLESQLRSRNGEQNRNPAAVRDQIKQAKALKSHLSASFDSFKTSIHRKRLSSDSHPADSNPALLEMKRALLERLESAIEPDVLKTISMIDSMIERAESAVK